MNIHNILTTIVPILLGGFVLRYITLSAGSPLLQSNADKLVLKPHRFYGYIGILSIFGVIFLYVMILISLLPLNLVGIIWLHSILIIFLIIGLYLVIFAFINKVIVKDRTIVSYSFWRKPILIEIREIKEISFGQVGLSLKLDDGKKSAYIHLHHIGFPNVIDILKKEQPDLIKVPLEKIEKAYGNITRGIYRKSDKSVF